MKINIIKNPASQGYLLGKALEKLDHKVSYYTNKGVLNTSPSKIHDIGKTTKIPFERTLKKYYYGIFHSADLEICNSIMRFTRAKERINWWHGSDIRLGTYPFKNFLWRFNGFVSTPDLLNYNKHLILLPRIVDSDIFNQNQESLSYGTFDEMFDFTIGYFPSNITAKGSEKILEAITELRKKYNFNFINNFDGMIPREEMPNIISQCTFVIDQYTPHVSCIGMNGLEAIKMGVSVTGSFKSENAEDDELNNFMVPMYEEKGEIKIDIEEVLSSTGRTRKAGSKYIERVHSPTNAIKVLQEYRVI